jgi:hypothetical protein
LESATGFKGSGKQRMRVNEEGKEKIEKGRGGQLGGRKQQ